MTDFGQELDELRREAGLSFRELAAAAGIDAGYLNHLVKGRRGHRISDELLERLAVGLDVKPDRFGEYRRRRVLEQHPDLVDELYQRFGDSVTLRRG